MARSAVVCRLWRCVSGGGAARSLPGAARARDIYIADLFCFSRQ
ncbi:hypothetical protein A2U01_0084113, partial [Trifolium medium]|nr:hypothetical protein [Trifolium medium]